MSTMKTPGVYIVEKNAFPNSVVAVPTAVPAFIGYTEMALNGNTSLTGQPWRITSMAEFHSHFGGPAKPSFAIEKRANGAGDDGPSELSADGTSKTDPLLAASFAMRSGKNGVETFDLKQTSPAYGLYGAIRLFYQNGGGPCYIVSVGSYEDDLESGPLLGGITALLKEPEPTMVVVPETTRLSRADAVKVQQQMLMHCGGKMRNRFAILDIFGGYRDRQDEKGDPVATFRNDLGVNFLDFGAAYYPWVHSSVFGARDFTYEMIEEESRPILIDVLKRSLNPGNLLPPAQLKPTYAEIEQVAAEDGADGVVSTAVNQPVTIPLDGTALDPETVELDGADDGSDGKTKTVDDVGVWTVVAPEAAITFVPVAEFAGPEAQITFTAKTADGEDVPAETITVMIRPEGPSPDMIDKTLRAVAPLYGEITDAIAKRMNCMPPAAAMAGIYTMVDNTRGVWKAPANVSLNAVTAPTVQVGHDDQEDLNVTPQGKSINAIRPFIGEGVLVWGARTLDGNSLDWRYVNVRRTMIFLEESIRLASKAYVFEPNTANTWVTMRSMIENFLTSIWKQGGLAGAVPEDAFSVHVGLGETMTPNDILEGILRITVMVAISRPAEFIEITFQQQMQKS